MGRRMGEHVIDRSTSVGYRRMQFNCVVSTNVAAIGLWESLEFRIVGTVPGGFKHRTSGYVDTLTMFREL